MHLIKIKDIHIHTKGDKCYIVAEHVTAVLYQEVRDTTVIWTVDNGVHEVKGDKSVKLAKLICTLTGGNTATLDDE